MGGKRIGAEARSVIGQDGLWRTPYFLPLWLGSFVSALADSAYFIVLAWFVLHVTHSPADLGLALLLASLPRLVFMAIGGVIIDRLSPRVVLLASLALRAVIMGVVCDYAAHGLSHALPVYVVAFLFGVIDAFYWPAQNAIVPFAVPSSALARANAVIQTSQQLSMVLGPLLAGFLLQVPQFSVIFAVIATTYLFGFIVIVRVRLRQKTHMAAGRSEGLFRALTQGIRYVLHLRIVLFLMLASMLINLFFMGPVNIGLPSFVQDHGWSGSVYGYFESALGLGAVAGGILVGLLNGMRGHFRWIALTASGIGVGLAITSLVGAWDLGIIAIAGSGLAISLTDIPVITYVQTIVDENMLGRVMSLLTLMSVGLTPVSYGLSALAIHRHMLTPQSLMLGGGSLVAVLCAALIFQPDFRSMENHPRWQQARLSKDSHGGKSLL
ncbi:MAG: MFS transporter [Firmicutes bacterium]|nr:MFS transporter [Bacillota bacterium]